MSHICPKMPHIKNAHGCVFMLDIIFAERFSPVCCLNSIHSDEEKFLKSPPAQTITCSFMLYQENILASCVVSFCVPTGCYGSPLLSGRTLNGQEIFRCHSDVLRSGFAKHAFFIRNNSRLFYPLSSSLMLSLSRKYRWPATDSA